MQADTETAPYAASVAKIFYNVDYLFIYCKRPIGNHHNQVRL